MSAPEFGNESANAARSALLVDQGKDTGARIDNLSDCFPEFVGRSRRLQEVLITVGKVARTESAVLILGESGTGKELIAAALHRLSPRSAKRFVAINCSAIPENLLESELFGHERGAFTGADRRRIGHFEAAHGGTIFLDEIGDMPISLQSKLLRVLQEKKFTPLGGNESRPADVRIVAATNKNLENAVEAGTFRLDLYYRLNVLPISVAPLRERREDIPLLLEHFIGVANRNHSSQECSYFAPDVVDSLTAYDWPGNVRQLQNLVERLVVLRGGGRIDHEHLPDEYNSVVVAPVTGHETIPSFRPTTIVPSSFGQLPTDGIDLIKFIEGLENSLIVQALERTNNNKNQAARLLGLNRTTLVERIKKRKIASLNPPSKEL